MIELNIKTQNLIKLMYNVFSCISEEKANSAIRTAYIWLAYANAYNFNEEDTKKGVFTALFHNIGEFIPLYPYKHTQTNDAISSYLFLKHFSPVKIEDMAVIYQNATKNDLYINNKIYRAGALIRIVKEIDERLNKNLEFNEIFKELRETNNFFESQIDKVEKLFQNLSPKDLEISECLKQCEKYFSKLYLTYSQTFDFVNLMGLAFSSYNEETLTHSFAVANISYQLAKRCNLNIQEQEDLYIAGMMHDIGKLVIPKKVLNKPTKLTKEEFELVKTHTINSLKIVKECLPPTITDPIFRHHEKLDGSGYPLGLTDKNLTIKDRILTIADITSALNTKRSYKSIWEKQEIISELIDLIKENKIDKNITTILISNYDEINEITNVYGKKIEDAIEESKREFLKIKKEKFNEMINNNEDCFNHTLNY